ncbi:MAG: helix-turn-helix domain-containing protein, partial [Pseudonocardiaceae bacterium]
MPLSGDTRRGRAIAAYRTGATGREIAADLGVHPSTVWCWVHRLDAARRTGPRGRTGVPTNRIITLRDVEGLSFADIAAAVRMTKSGVI